MQDQQSIMQEQDRELVVQMVKQLLRERPNDVVPFMYSFLKQKNQGVANPKCTTNNQVAEIKNLRKKVEYLRSQLKEDEGPLTTESEESGDEVEEIQPKKKNTKKQRAGVSAEVYGEHNKKGDFQARVIKKTTETEQKLRARLLQAFMFSALDTKELDVVVGAIEEVQAKAGDNIITEGDSGDCMYVLEQGSLDCTKVFAGNTEPTFLKEYVPGEGFGELALLYNAPRAATITAKVPSIVWKLDRDTFNNIVKDAAQRKREKYDAFLQSVPILQSMDPYERSKLGDAVREERFAKGAYVITQGDNGDKFFMITEGEAIATKSMGQGKEPIKVMDYAKGSYFGERALLTNDLRAANIVATTDVVSLSLERDTFMRLLGPLDDILKRNMDQYKKYK